MSTYEIVEQCVGCDAAVNLNPADVVAYAIMKASDYAGLGLDRPPAYIATRPGRRRFDFGEDQSDAGDWFVAAPLCRACHTNPGHRARTLKAHYALPRDARRLTEMAGSSAIGGAQ